MYNEMMQKGCTIHAQMARRASLLLCGGGMIMIRPSDVVLHKPTGETWEIGK